MDIYVSELIDDEWSEPINLGPKVNTAADDLYPFIFEDSLLYFATSGRLGLGGLDVFVYNFKEKSTKKNSKEKKEIIINENSSPVCFAKSKEIRDEYQ